MSQLGLDRHSLIIGLGGGSVTDLTGFVAACYMRGIDCWYVPTTLMGMILMQQSEERQELILKEEKNLIGNFRAPRRMDIIRSPLIKYPPSKRI